MRINISNELYSEISKKREMDFARLYNSVSHYNNIIIPQIPKVASGGVRRLIFEDSIRSAPRNPDHKILSDWTRKSITNEIENLDSLEDYRVVLLWRNPLDRLRSLYEDIILGDQKKYSLAYARSIINKTDFSFNEFIEHYIRRVPVYQSDFICEAEGIQMDRHHISIVNFITQQHIDILLNIDKPKEAYRRFFNQTGISFPKNDKKKFVARCNIPGAYKFRSSQIRALRAIGILPKNCCYFTTEIMEIVRHTYRIDYMLGEELGSWL